MTDIPEELPQAQGVPVYHPSDYIRRAALAIRENWSNDTMKRARIALEAAFHRWRGHGQYKAYVAFCELDHRSAMIKELRGCERVIVVTAA